ARARGRGGGSRARGARRRSPAGARREATAARGGFARRESRIDPPMGFADVWNRTLGYFGIAEEDEEWDEEGYLANDELQRTYSERPNVRRLAPARRRRDPDDWSEPEPEQTAVIRPSAPPRLRGVEAAPS